MQRLPYSTLPSPTLAVFTTANSVRLHSGISSGSIVRAEPRPKSSTRLCHSCYRVALRRTGTCQTKASRKSVQRTRPRAASGRSISPQEFIFRYVFWEREQPAEAKPQTARDYETVGLVLEGKAELHIEGQLVLLEKGDSWVVPKGSRHTYKVSETFTAVEATSPPAEVHGRDE